MAVTNFEVVAHTRAGHERVHSYAVDEPLEPGSVIRLEGRFWLVERVDGNRAFVEPARYRLRLRHPDGREEQGVFRRYRTDAPQLGHVFTTLEDGQPVSWAVVDERLARDADGVPYLDLVAERDFTEVEELPDHELEHARAASEERLTQAADAGLSVELVSLEPGELPNWDDARRYLDSLTLDEIEDDLLELCGVDPNRDPRENWLETVHERLRTDLERFRADVEGAQDEIEEWEFLDGKVFAAFGDVDDEANPDVGFGWLSRLVDSGVSTAAGFTRVRKPELDLSE